MPHDDPSPRSESLDSSPLSASAFSRRRFLNLATAGLGAMGGAATITPPSAEAAALDPITPRQRSLRAYAIRHKAALQQHRVRLPLHPNNGDEQLYPNRIANFSKGLPHDAYGEVDPSAYDALLHALHTGRPEDFEAVPMGASSPATQRKFVNPQSGYAFDLEGADSHSLAIPPAPAFGSLEQAGEIVENYWMALLRDVPFADYATNPLAQAAMDDLSALADFRGPKIAGRVTAQTLFRGNLPGATAGPYLSQFLLLPVPFGAAYVEQRMRTVIPGVNYLTQFPEWLSAQRGEQPAQTLTFDPTRRYIRNGRDLGQWVHVDVLYQAYFQAMLIMLAQPDAADFNSDGLGVPFDPANPYAASLTQEGFGTFGGPHIAALLCEVASRALKAVWFQKWCVHRRLRPEVFAGRVHSHFRGLRNYPIAADELLRLNVLTELFNRQGSYLLPSAFPEGSPLHPSYGAGHATVAGACVTILKAWFAESYIIADPVTVSPDGLSLIPYSGPPLTVGGELNKLAANIAIGRDIAGVHWRSDATASLRLGEAIALSVLKDQRLTFNENFDGFTLTTFDGETITV